MKLNMNFKYMNTSQHQIAEKMSQSYISEVQFSPILLCGLCHFLQLNSNFQALPQILVWIKVWSLQHIYSVVLKPIL